MEPVAYMHGISQTYSVEVEHPPIPFRPHHAGICPRLAPRAPAAIRPYLVRYRGSAGRGWRRTTFGPGRVLFTEDTVAQGVRYALSVPTTSHTPLLMCNS